MTNFLVAQPTPIKKISTVNIKKKLLDTWRADQLHQQSGNKWISSSAGRCEIWEGDSTISELFFLGLYINSNDGDLVLEGTIINGGYFQYDYKKEQLISQSNYVELIKDYHPKEISSIHYSISDCVFDKKKERAVLSLNYRPTRRNYEEKTFAWSILALMNTKTDSVITIFNPSELLLPSDVKFTSDYIIALYYNTLSIWNLSDGQEKQHTLVTDINHIDTNKEVNKIIAVTSDSTVFQYDVSSGDEIIIPFDKKISSAFFLTNDVFLFVDAQNKCSINRLLETGTLELIYEFSANGKVNDVFYNEKEATLHIATDNSEYPIILLSGF